MLDESGPSPAAGEIILRGLSAASPPAASAGLLLGRIYPTDAEASSHKEGSIVAPLCHRAVEATCLLEGGTSFAHPINHRPVSRPRPCIAFAGQAEIARAARSKQQLVGLAVVQWDAATSMQPRCRITLQSWGCTTPLGDAQQRAACTSEVSRAVSDHCSGSC